MEWIFFLSGAAAVAAGAAVFLLERGRTRMPPARPAAAPEPAGAAAEPSRRGASTEVRPIQHTTPRPGARTPAAAVTRSQTRGPARWIRPGETVEVAGFTIRGGLLYVGASLPSARGHEDDYALVNTSKRVASSGADIAGRSMGYWPSYSAIQPAERLAYLEWLSTGRKDPRYGVGYAFLFLYGLERRLLVDGDHGDAAAIAAELRRLLGLYGGNASFRGYARPLVDVADHFAGTGHEGEPTVEDARAHHELPLGTRIRLGRKLARREPLGADDALLWTMQSQGTRIRTATTRCFPETLALWRTKFAAEYPQGLRVDVPASRVSFTYQSASNTFQRDVVPTAGGAPLPDIAASAAPLKRLRELFEACAEELDPYSRLLGKKPDAKGTAEAALLLPRMILDTGAGAPVRELNARVLKLLGGRAVAAVGVPDLLSAVGMAAAPGGKLTAALCGEVAALLDRLDLAFEPDRRYGPASLEAGGKAVVFRAPGGAPVDAARPQYQSARTMLEVAALAAAADGNPTPADLDAIRADVGQSADLAPGEKARLLALAMLWLRDAPRQGTILGRLARLPEAERRRVARSALSAILADGQASPAEVSFLEKLHKALDLPISEVYGQLHRGGVAVDEPTTVAAEEPGGGTPIPAEADDARAAPPPGRTVAIDAAKLARIRAETADVSEMLAGIFVDDAPPAPPAAVSAPPAAVSAPPAPDGAAFRGLDGPHAALLGAVLAAGAMSRPEFEAAARALRLLPGGAIETINEWAFDALDEAALDDDDDVAVPAHLRGTLAEMGKTA